MNFVSYFWAVVDALDRSYSLLCRNYRLACVVFSIAVLYFVLRFLYRRVYPAKSAYEKLVKYLISSSARHVDSAVALQRQNILESYEHAIYGSVMASAAKDLVDDKETLSKELNVDIYEYVDYTNKVLSQVKASLKGES